MGRFGCKNFIDNLSDIAATDRRTNAPVCHPVKGQPGALPATSGAAAHAPLLLCACVSRDEEKRV